MKFETDKWIEVLDFLLVYEAPTVMSISKELDVTYTHILKIIKMMKDKRLVKTEKIGRMRAVKLTTKGKELAFHCSPIVRFVKSEM